jgi:hypothetical protein
VASSASRSQDAGGLVGRQGLAAALVVGGGLGGEVLGRGRVELAVEDRVAGGVFVDVGGAVADPLARDEDRQLDVQLDLAHLERRRVPVAHQVADQAGVVARGLRARAVADARGLDDRAIVAHVVDDADEAVVEHRDRLVQERLDARRGGAAGDVLLGMGGVDFGLLFGRQRHIIVLKARPRGEGFADTISCIRPQERPKMKIKYLHTMVRVTRYRREQAVLLRPAGPGRSGAPRARRGASRWSSSRPRGRRTRRSS